MSMFYITLSSLFIYSIPLDKSMGKGDLFLFIDVVISYIKKGYRIYIIREIRYSRNQVTCVVVCLEF